MDKIKQIGFKAGEKPKRPVIQEDTSASKSYASIAYGISEGEIVGLIDGAKSVYLDGTPVASVSGDINIPDVKIQERKGTNDQTHLEGFPAVVNEKQYNNIEMLQTTPFVHYINDTNLDAVGIRFTFGALQETNPDNGNVSGTTIEYAIDVQADGQGYQELLRTSVVGKYSAGYQRYHRVELPPAEEGWEVRIRRITPNTTSTYIADKMYLDAVAEILDVKMRYPNTALIGLKFDSERFSNIPKVDFRMRGKIICVPANYDPVARTYTQSGTGTTNGIWNGQFKMAYTTNPAWIFYDLVLNKRYGLGNRIDPSMLDKWSLYSIAQYCDVMVPDGEGGLEPRFTCNVYINNRFEAYDCLMQLAGVFRGIMYWSGTAIIAGCDRPQDPVFTYTRANIVGEFNYSGTRTKDRHSVVMVSFDDPKNNYKTEKEVVSDRKAISEIGIRTKDLAAFACTSRGQAQRAGKWALFKEQLETRIVTFALGMDGYIAPVGRVIEIADPLLAGRAVGGRIAAVSVDKKTITLDRDTEVKIGDRLVLNNEEGEQESRQVASVSGRSVTVAVAFESPAVQHVWAIDSDDLQLMRFTVISVAENRSQDSINFTVTALQHEPALHEAADYSAHIDRNTYSVIDITTQKAPAEVLISSVNRINQGIDLTDLVISWKQAENAVKYHVQWRRDDGNWIQLPLQYGNQVTIENIYHGVYEAKVVAINAADINSSPTSSLPTLINSKFAEPAILASFTANGILFGIELNWKFPLYGAQNAAFVEIYWALRADKEDEKLLGSYAYPTTETTLNGLGPHLTIYFRARLVDRNGVASGFTPWVSATVDANPEKLIDLISGHITESTLDQILQGKIDGAGALAGEAQTLANQAAVAADQAAIKAQEAANAVVQEATDRAIALTIQANTLKADSAAKVQALKDEVDPKITTLQNGITQVTTDYNAADTLVVGQLNAYKTSNDSAVASVLQKAESAVSTGSTNSSAITAINGQITALNGALSTKLDASVISGYYTKGQTDAKAAEIAAGKVEEFNASLKFGAKNLLKDSGSLKSVQTGGNGTVTNGVFSTISNGTEIYIALDTHEELAVGKYTLSVYVNSNGLNNGITVPYKVGDAEWTHYTYYEPKTSNGWVRLNFPVNVTTKGVVRVALDNYCNTTGTLSFKMPQLERGEFLTDWSSSEVDTQNAINANSTAIQNTNAEVSRVDGLVTATNSAITSLSGRVSNVEGAVTTKADASALTALTTRVGNAEGVNTSQGTAITTLQNTVDHATTELATKASTSALTATNSEVARVNGVVTGHASQLTQLASDITTINGTLATKANASAINDIYTKTQADDKSAEIAAGQITAFEATLALGGGWMDIGREGAQSVIEFGAGTVEVIDRTLNHFKITATSGGALNAYIEACNNSSAIPVGTPYVMSGKVRASRANLYDRIYARFNQHSSESYVNGWNASTDWVSFKTTGVTNTQNQSSTHNIIGALVPNAIAGDWVEFKDCRIAVNSDSVTAANANAITNTNAEVSRVDGRVTTTSDHLISVTGRVSNVENGLALKADVSALSNIYTKSETDAKATSIAAGEVSKYDANLVIGGANLLLNSNFSEAAHWSKWDNNGGGYIKVTDPMHGSVVQTTLPYGLSHAWVKLENNVEYTYSALVKPSNDLYPNGNTPLHYWAGKDNQPQYKIHVLSYSPTVIEAGKWTRISIVFKLTDDADSFRPFIYGLNGVLQLAWTKLERGNKATDWTPNDQEVQQSINANANAIQTVNAEVSRINGEVVATANSVSTLSSNVGLLQGSINEVRQTVTNNQESTNTLVTSLRSGMADADDVSMMMRNATVLYEDLNFRDGYNGVGTYNNYGNGALTLNFTGKLPDNPVASTRQLQFIHTGGATTPALGGFYQLTFSRPNGVFLVKFVAKLPVGFSFDLAANAYGDGANAYFIGGNEGTGKFKTYYGVYRCGTTGSFNIISFVFVRGPLPTPENPLIWYLASSTVYDCLDSKVAPDSVVNGIAEAKSTASTAVNKAEATALIAQNLQASLNNTNANIATNYYTRAEADNVVAGKIEQFSSSVYTSNENLFKGNILHVAKTYASGISSFNYGDFWVIDANSGNGHWIALDLGVSSQTMNNNGVYWGPVTVSMDYLMERGNPEALPTMYFGHGYQTFVHSQKGPHVLYKWYRIYTTFYTDANTLLSSPHLGVGGIAGRIGIRNLKIERGGMTAYSVDVRETTQSINGIEAIKTVTIDNNGVMSGYGLISELKNGQVTSAFGVNADTFYIGSPSLDKKPFIQRNAWSVINDVWLPPGTYIDTAYIGTSTIGNAHIKNLAVTAAKIDNLAVTTGKIDNLAVTTAKIGDLQVSTLKIADRAVTLPYFYVDTAPASIINRAYSSFPLHRGNNRTIPTISGISFGGFTPYADVLVLCDVKLWASIIGNFGGFHGLDTAIVNMSNSIATVPMASRVTARLLAGYYNTSFGGETENSQIIGLEAKEIFSINEGYVNVNGTALNLGGTYTRRLKADSAGNIAISLWVSSYGAINDSCILSVRPSGSVVWYAQELKK